MAVGWAVGSPGEAPFKGIGGGEPLGRTMKTGPVSAASGVFEGSGGGVSTELLGCGVGAMSSPGPGGGTPGMCSGVAVGLGLGTD